MKPKYRLYTHDGYYDVAADGSILYESKRDYRRSTSHARVHEWRIIGIGTRAESKRLVSLAEAARGTDIGQGWVHDMDHGTHRMWSMPKSQRAKQVIEL